MTYSNQRGPVHLRSQAYAVAIGHQAAKMMEMCQAEIKAVNTSSPRHVSSYMRATHTHLKDLQKIQQQMVLDVVGVADYTLSPGAQDNLAAVGVGLETLRFEVTRAMLLKTHSSGVKARVSYSTKETIRMLGLLVDTGSATTIPRSVAYRVPSKRGHYGKLMVKIITAAYKTIYAAAVNATADYTKDAKYMHTTFMPHDTPALDHHVSDEQIKGACLNAATAVKEQAVEEFIQSALIDHDGRLEDRMEKLAAIFECYRTICRIR